MHVSEESLGDVLILKFEGRVDAFSASGLKERVKSLIKDGRLKVVFDLGKVDFIDSSGLGGLVAALRSMNKAGGDIKVAALQDRVRAIFELIRLHLVFEIFDDSVGAAESFS
jgi:anti-sigma B factor antagonist